MAEAEIKRHVEEAQSRWPLLGVTVIHRFGRFSPGESIVLVVATSSHREAAFAAAEFLMTISRSARRSWKKEERAGGDDGWVEARHTDAVAAKRWAAGGSTQDERKPEAAE